MARFIDISYSHEHAGINRVTRGFAAVRELDRTVSRPLLAVLHFIGAPVHGVAAKVATRLAGWKAARKQAAEDRKLWDLALTDARVMADLSRAMSQEASRGARYY